MKLSTLYIYIVCVSQITCDYETLLYKTDTNLGQRLEVSSRNLLSR